tara:strand:- start:6127 stop:7131 length:1005 start_codon:yes stop_codon:yes gene_type:complete
MKKVAFITGISGQDGSYLAEHLLNDGYTVHGMIRRQSVAENQESRLDHIIGQIHTHYGDLLDIPSIFTTVSRIQPTHIFNLGAMSHVRISSEMPSFTIQTNALGVLNLLEVYRQCAPEARFYQASSSEMFGDSIDEDQFQRETTPMTPVSPYGCSKLLAYSLVRHYRHAYSLHASNGILFNHESPRRGSNFVTNKVVKTAVEIKMGLKNKLTMGNLDSYRDWGHSKDYTRGMIQIISHETPEDFVLASGETHSVRDLCDVVFKILELDYKDYVVQDEKYFRPQELKYLKGDASKARTVLSWRPEYTFKSMLEEMVKHWLKHYNEKYWMGKYLDK